MFNIQTTDSIVSGIAFLLAYIASVTIAGALCARILAWLGDETARSYGFTSFNPLVHMDFLGFFCLYFAGLGWGRRIPFDPSTIKGRFAPAKILLAFFAEGLIYMGMALIAILILLTSLGAQAFAIMMPMFAYFDFLSSRLLTTAYPNLPSLHIVLAFIIICAVYINIMCATLSILLNAFRYTVDALVARYGNLGRYTDILLIIIPFALIFIFARPLRIIIIKSICTLGFIIGSQFCLI